MTTYTGALGRSINRTLYNSLVLSQIQFTSLSNWETAFISSIVTTWGRGNSISDRQRATLENILTSNGTSIASIRGRANAQRNIDEDSQILVRYDRLEAQGTDRTNLRAIVQARIDENREIIAWECEN